MTVWLVVLVAGAVSYLFRFVPAALVDRVRPLPVLDRASALAVPVVFAALAAAAVVARSSAAAGLEALAPLGAVAAAVVAVRRTGSSYAAIAVGMPALWLLQAGLS
jgi:branched-subunit amino acid transport protein